MTELTDLNDTDALNTEISGQSIEGSTANMGGMDNLQQAIAGMLSRFRNANIFRLRDNTDKTKILAFDLSGQATAETRTQKTPNYNGTMASQALGTAIASASSIDLGAASGSTVHITGTTAITALGTADAGIQKTVIFDGVLTFTHNATSLILPGGANITTAAGDVAVMMSEGSGNWRCLSYPRITKEYVSAEQTITAATVIGLTHGLGSVPKIIAAELVCKTAELGYSVGAVVCVDSGQKSTSIADSYGMAVVKDAASVTLVYGADAGVFNIIRADSFTAATITAANWRLVVRAWA